MVDRLGDVLMRDPERGRESLREVLDGERIKLKPDESRSFPVAEYALGVRALLPADTVVAGAGFVTYLHEWRADLGALKCTDADAPRGEALRA